MKLKKPLAFLSAAVLAVTGTQMASVSTSMTATAESKYNYAEALQKSMFFYEVQQAGILPEWNEVSWKADSMVKEDGTPADVVDGGWFDAGDHLKFTLTNAYTASVLAWGLLQYGDAVKEAGLYDLYMNNLKWGLDYVAACDLGDKVIGTIGEDGFDHVWWGSAEVYLSKFALKNDGLEDRPYDTITCTTTVAEMAAALAGGYLLLKDTDAATADSYLEHAKSLFQLADDTWSNDDMGIQEKYYSTKHNSGTDNFVDELFYAANWMYMATGDQSYLDLCESKYIPIFPKESQSTAWKYTWGFCWDDTTQGAALLYAINTGKQEWIDHVSHHLDYWMDGYGGKVVNKTPDGLSYLDQWGSLRYAEGTAMLAKIASDTIFKDNASLADKYNTWAKSQMDYAFGDNDLGLCYVLGMGDKNPVNVHHRTASGCHDDHWNALGYDESESEDGLWQTEYAHVLYGALEGGPNMDGTFKDENASYTNTEVAIDYNAAFTACLCAMIDDYGGEKLADFPQAETPKWSEWIVSAKLNGKGNSYTEVKAYAMNHTAWPTRVVKDLEYRYYFDVSELLAAGLSVDQIKVESKSQQYQSPDQAGYATATGPYLYEGDPSGNTYYAKIKFEDGRAVMPTGQSEHRCEMQFRISIPDAIDGQSTAGAWDPTNDWSYPGLEDAPDKLELPVAWNNHITMYANGVLVWGEEPDGTVPTKSDYEGKPSVTPSTPTTTTTTPTITTTTATEPLDLPTTTTVTTTINGGTTIVGNTMLGDVDLDDKITMSDAVVLNKALSGDVMTALNAQQQLNAACLDDGELNAADAKALLSYIVGNVKELPVAK